MTSTPLPVRALSLWRPWPFMILHAGKNIENRSWATRYRGPLVLHAGRTVQEHMLAQLARTGRGAEVVAVEGFVGVVTLTGCHPATECGGCSPWASPTGYHWTLADPQPFNEPIAGRGRQRLFTPPDAVIHALTQAVSR
jgi:hypothetical protein